MSEKLGILFRITITYNCSKYIPLIDKLNYDSYTNISHENNNSPPDMEMHYAFLLFPTHLITTIAASLSSTPKYYLAHVEFTVDVGIYSRSISEFLGANVQ